MSSLQTQKSKGISKIWLTNDISATLIIPVEIAKKTQPNEGKNMFWLKIQIKGF